MSTPDQDQFQLYRYDRGRMMNLRERYNLLYGQVNPGLVEKLFRLHAGLCHHCDQPVPRNQYTLALYPSMDAFMNQHLHHSVTLGMLQLWHQGCHLDYLFQDSCKAIWMTETPGQYSSAYPVWAVRELEHDFDTE